MNQVGKSLYFNHAPEKIMTQSLINFINPCRHAPSLFMVTQYHVITCWGRAESPINRCPHPEAHHSTISLLKPSNSSQIHCHFVFTCASSYFILCNYISIQTVAWQASITTRLTSSQCCSLVTVPHPEVCQVFFTCFTSHERIFFPYVIQNANN